MQIKLLQARPDECSIEIIPTSGNAYSLVLKKMRTSDKETGLVSVKSYLQLPGFYREINSTVIDVEHAMSIAIHLAGTKAIYAHQAELDAALSQVEALINVA
jgi:hypothetical protein